MGKRKPKEREPTYGNDAAPVQSDIFKTLFGSAPPQDAVVSSLFSDDNPFRRKPQEPASVENAETVGVVDSEIAELKYRKRSKGRMSSLDLDSEKEEAGHTETAKKSKKGKTQNPGSGAESKGAPEDKGEEKPNLGLEANGASKKDKGKELLSDSDAKSYENAQNSDKKRRKKRKRDEIERDYETRKYGMAPEDEEKKNEGDEAGGKKVGEKRKKPDDPVDIMVSKEGFDDDSKLLRTVFVGNLPLKVKKKALLKEFSRFGEVESVRIRSVPLVDTKQSRKGAIMQKQINENASSVHAYVVFKTEHSAEASLAHNMAVVGGNHIRVDRACPPRKKLRGQSAPLYDNKRTVFVGNIPFDVKDEELYQLFSSIPNLESSVEAVRVVRDAHMSLGKGIAYVLFKTREAANAVIKKGRLKLRDRELRLSHARSSSTPSKRKNPSPGAEANSPAKKLAVDSRSSADKHIRYDTKADLSYQGLRSTKSGVKGKMHSKYTRPLTGKPKIHKREKPKERQQKRAAVAARKAKQKALQNGGATKQAGTKRKLDSRTPESFHKKKKAKKF